MSPKGIHLAACVVCIALFASSLPALAITGTVVDAEGEPVQDAKVCQLLGRAEGECSLTDEAGVFELVNLNLILLRVVAKGHVAKIVNNFDPAVPIVIQASPTLVVRLVDASDGTRIGAGEMHVVYPSGSKVGPFPINAAGVRVKRVLEPGEVRIVIDAEGYESPKPHAVTLEPGKEETVILELQPGGEESDPSSS